MARTNFSPNTPALSSEVNDNFDGAYSGEYWESDVRGGWLAALDSWVYASASSFTIAGVDRSSQFPKGTKIRLVQSGSTKYFYVTSSSFSTDTTVNITAGSDFTLANAAISSPSFSHAASPVGFQHWFNWTPTFTGFSAAPASGTYKFSITGDTCYVVVDSGTGTSNATNFYLTGPVARGSNAARPFWAASSVNSGATSTTWPEVAVMPTQGSSEIRIRRSGSDTSWTASGAKGTAFVGFYQF